MQCSAVQCSAVVIVCTYLHARFNPPPPCLFRSVLPSLYLSFQSNDKAGSNAADLIGIESMNLTPREGDGAASNRKKKAKAKQGTSKGSAKSDADAVQV